MGDILYQILFTRRNPRWWVVTTPPPPSPPLYLRALEIHKRAFCDGWLVAQTHIQPGSLRPTNPTPTGFPVANRRGVQRPQEGL